MNSGSNLLVTNRKDIKRVACALASSARLKILEACTDKFLSVSNLSEVLNMPQSTVTTHIQVLEEAGLLETRSETGRRGRQKLCKASYEHISFAMDGTEKTSSDTIEIDMPVGLFTAISVKPPCGLVSTEAVIGEMDVPESFLLPERADAGLLWFEEGWVEYSFPTTLPKNRKVESVEISFEACSEAIDWNEDWPSDISLWINETKVGFWTYPGDYGNPRGVLTPAWWPDRSTQYGILKKWRITESGTYLDDVPISGYTLDDLDIMSRSVIMIRIGIEDEAANKRGINLFGSSYGNYPQAIKLIIRLAED